MSYDVSLVIDTGGEWPTGVSEGRNYTYNVAPMFRAAFGEPGIRCLDRLTGHDATPLLDKAIKYFMEHMNEMHEMDPLNGWGDAAGALQFLEQIAQDCRAHPKATVEIG